jgi:hypothetical protein
MPRRSKGISYVAVDGESPVSLARASSRLRSTLGLLGFGAGLGAANVDFHHVSVQGWIEVRMLLGRRRWLETLRRHRWRFTIINNRGPVRGGAFPCPLKTRMCLGGSEECELVGASEDRTCLVREMQVDGVLEVGQNERGLGIREAVM